MKNIRCISTALFALCFTFAIWFPSRAAAQTPPRSISYQGVISDLSGTPLNGAFDLTFRFFSQASGGAALWQETHANNTLQNGRFAVLLGSQTMFPSALDFSTAYWLETEVQAPSGTNATFPRIALQATPYANFAQEIADGAVATGKIQNGAVTLGKLDASGASEGQVLKFEGGQLTWGAVTPPNPPSLPPGAIVMWSGTRASIPAGWALCDGENGTPNLMDRFVVGVSDAEEPGSTGGSSTHTHTSPPHSHIVDLPPTVSSTTFYGSASPSARPIVRYVAVESSQVPFEHEHETDPPATPSAATSVTIDEANHLPPFFKIAFIMQCGPDPTNCASPQ